MKIHNSINALFLLALSGSVQAALNGPCTVGSTPGVCITTATCSSGGGTSASGYCPNDPADVKCCTKAACGNGGNCRFTSQCSGVTVSSMSPPPQLQEFRYQKIAHLLIFEFILG